MRSKFSGGATPAALDLIAARALWLSRQNAAPTAISAATQALVEGIDTEPIRELAGSPVNANVFELGALIDASLKSLDLPTSEMTKDDALLISARYFAQQVIHGELPIREFTAWAHSVIGHEGPSLMQDIVMLDDLYDGFEGGWGTEPDFMLTLEQFLEAAHDAGQQWALPRSI
ncbi:hypothetical protein [Arthrobacter sp. ISL-95]|uniref:hypothetical protein n=1 Tax=Arthrobacter sp. ISL-95 TaxID=2819116 RepID=UPI001BE9CEE4|nr:hypothetical protein [Arthrobacter sp. ISL-95]MBT2586471.1 hypothetical protein [Arthrobacter sp. ISL-95]